MRGEIRHYPKGVQSLFPEDRGLVELSAESYLAIPLMGPSGRVLGHLAVFDDKPMPGEPQDLSTFKIFAARAAAELERKQVESALLNTQAQLALAEKMASLGKLAAGLAHEVNNPIGVVQSAADTSDRCLDRIMTVLEESHTLDELRVSAPFQKSLELLRSNNQAIGKASSRTATFVSSLKNFARLDEAEFQRADIHEGLESTLVLLQHEIPENIQVARDYGHVPQICCYPGELNQVFMGVLRNAIQAIEKEGVITIKTSADEKDVYVEISDTGKGIPLEKMKTLFDFGFTTRGSRVGMGLGLPYAHNIIGKHNGEIRLESKARKGTDVLIRLPIEPS